MQSNHLASKGLRLTLPCAQLHVSRGCLVLSTSGSPLSAQSFRQQKQVLANPNIHTPAAGVSPSRNALVVRADMSASPFPSVNEAEAAVAQTAVRLASRVCRVSCCRQTVLVRHCQDNKRFCAYITSRFSSSGLQAMLFCRKLSFSSKISGSKTATLTDLSPQLF